MTLSPPDPAAAPRSTSDLPSSGLVPATERDRHINLGFEAYRPTRPLRGKVRAENLLWHSLLHAGQLDAWDNALHAVQRCMGRDRSIWGVFLEDGALSWELRVLNRTPSDAPTRESEDPLGVLGSLRAALEPWVELAPGVDADQLGPYAVLGLRFDTQTMSPEQGRPTIPAVELHEREQGSRDTEVYRVSADARELVSSELVLHPKRHIDEVLPAIKRSEFVDFAADPRLLGRVMIPELFACRRLHIAKRPSCDALCYSSVNIEQLTFTYKRFELPQAMLEFLAQHQGHLEHLLFDVAIEYCEHEGRIIYPRVGYYGSL